jgi:hypothetical protein
VWRVPPRNPRFTGRDGMLTELRRRLHADEPHWWYRRHVVIPEQLAPLAERLGLPLGPAVADTVDRLLAELRDQDRWPLILDNAERPADIAAYRPGGAGHVLITSRSPAGAP